MFSFKPVSWCAWARFFSLVWSVPHSSEREGGKTSRKKENSQKTTQCGSLEDRLFVSRGKLQDRPTQSKTGISSTEEGSRDEREWANEPWAVSEWVLRAPYTQSYEWIAVGTAKPRTGQGWSVGRAVPALVAFTRGLEASFRRGTKKKVMKSEKNLHLYLFFCRTFLRAGVCEAFEGKLCSLERRSKTNFFRLFIHRFRCWGSTRKTWIARVLFLLRFTEFVNLEVWASDGERSHAQNTMSFRWLDWMTGDVGGSVHCYCCAAVHTAFSWCFVLWQLPGCLESFAEMF